MTQNETPTKAELYKVYLELGGRNPMKSLTKSTYTMLAKFWRVKRIYISNCRKLLGNLKKGKNKP